MSKWIKKKVDQDKSRKVFTAFDDMWVVGEFKGGFNRKEAETRF